MRIKLTKHVQQHGRHYAAGSVVDVPEDMARSLVEADVATMVGEHQPSASAKAAGPPSPRPKKRRKRED